MEFQMLNERYDVIGTGAGGGTLARKLAESGKRILLVERGQFLKREITALKAENGQGIELLEYLAPSNGLPYPVSTNMNDPWSWRTRLVVDSADDAMRAAKASNVDFVSPGSVDIVDDEIGIDRGVTLSGPFGHRMILVEEAAK